ncbi:MAG: CDP-alcohol phosphatidyltransferase family protein [Candidatus Komeilibacteria bacterium]
MNRFIDYISTGLSRLNDWRDTWVQSKIRAYLQDFKQRSIAKKEYRIEKLFKPLIDKKITTAANLISIFRGLMALPLFIFILDERFGLSLAFFIFIMILDAVDGPLAKVLNEQSDLGEILDPTGDKLVFAAVFLTLGSGYLSTWLFTSIIIIELIIVAMALLLRPIGKRLNITFKKNATIWGKIKLTLQTFGCGFILVDKLGFVRMTPIVSTIFITCLVLAIASIFNYFKSVEKTTL